MGPFAILALGLFFVLSAVAQNDVMTSGAVTLEAGRRYRFVVFVPASLASAGGLAAVIDSLKGSGALETSIARTSSEGTYLAVVARSPSAITVTIGQELAPGTRLVSVERLAP